LVDAVHAASLFKPPIRSCASFHGFLQSENGQLPFLAPDWSTRSGSSYAFNILHQGGRYETVTGLYNFRNRELHPTLGRWVQTDPILFTAGDPNLYRLVGNNPTNALDPGGLLEFFVRPGRDGTESQLYVVREILWFDRPSTESWVGVVRPDGRIERGGFTATLGAVETAGYQENWVEWFRENGSEINPSAVVLPHSVTDVDRHRALDPDFDQRGPQLRGMVIGMGVFVGTYLAVQYGPGQVLRWTGLRWIRPNGQFASQAEIVAAQRVLRHRLESLQHVAGQAGRARAAGRELAGRLSEQETRAMLEALRQQGWRWPRGVEEGCVGGRHINIIGPSGESIHLPVPPGFCP
jgi:RHS repeat-associated protein